jgi:hypothetical protein
MEELIETFENIKGYFTGDYKLVNFIKKEPDNQCREITLEKILACGGSSLLKIETPALIANRILTLNIDNRLKMGDLELVTEMANSKSICDSFELYYFCSKYCCFHSLNKFPIYSVSGRRIIDAFTASNNLVSFSNYGMYSQLIKEFVNRFGITSLNYLELNKFLWLNEDKLLAMINKSSLSPMEVCLEAIL